METVTVSPKFQVVIPLAVREAMRLVPGEKMHVLLFNSRVELIRVRQPKEMRGVLAGMGVTLARDGDRV